MLLDVTWCIREPQDVEDPTIAVKDKTTGMKETSRLVNNPGVGKAREPAAVTRKAEKTMALKTREDKDTAETVGPVETTATHTTAPSDTNQAKKAAPVDTMKAIGEAVKAMEDTMGPKIRPQTWSSTTRPRTWETLSTPWN